MIHFKNSENFGIIIPLPNFAINATSSMLSQLNNYFSSYYAYDAMSKLFQFFLFLSINILFVAKYSARIIEYPIFITIPYLILASLIYWLLSFKINYIKINKLRFVYWFISGIILLIIVLLLHFINPLSVHVDRWSAIHFFIKNLLSGQYPYLAHSHLGNFSSPFPVWECFHIPFYLLGDVGYGMLFSFIVLSILLVWILDSYRKAFIYLILLFISPAFWYEVAVRSDLFYNLLLCFLAIGIIEKKQYSIQKNLLGLGVLCGLFLSTRIAVIIPFIMFLFQNYIKASLSSKILFPIIVLSTFALTILPFAIWNFNALFFFKYNPFILQFRQGSPFEMIIIWSIIIVLSLKWKTITTCFSYTAVGLILTVFLSILFRMIQNHFIEGLFSDAYDITYFNMALPFILYTLAQDQSDSFSKLMNPTIV